MAEKKNPDYTATAINLTNPNEVRALLSTRHEIQKKIDSLDANLRAYPEYDLLKEEQALLAENEHVIREVIDKYGSYQDTIAGCYAVKQVRKTITFLADKVRQIIPQYADAVIDGVNKAKMEGLVKGGLITQEQVDQCGQTKETFAYIIK